MSTETTPIVPHQAGEFFAWLWWTTEERSGAIDLGGDLGSVDVWVDERLAFRHPADTKISAVMTGDNPSASLESRAAMAGGKVLQEVRIGLRREDREYLVTLKAPAIDIKQAKMPSGTSDGEDAAIFDRMFFYEELNSILGGLVRRFSDERISDAWELEVVPAVRAWINAERTEA